MSELCELDRFLNLPDLPLKRLWNLLDDDKDQTLKFLIALCCSEDFFYDDDDDDEDDSEEDDCYPDAEEYSYDSNDYHTFINPITAYKRFKLNEDLASWLVRCACGSESSDLFDNKPKLFEEWWIYMSDCAVLAERYEEQVLNIKPDHNPRQCVDCVRLREKGLEHLGLFRVSLRFAFGEIRRHDHEDGEEHYGRRRLDYDSDSEDEFDKILWCCPKYFDSFAVAILKLFKQKIRPTDNFDAREEFHRAFVRAVSDLARREWSGEYDGKAFRILPGEDVINRPSFVKNMKKALSIFMPLEPSVVKKIAKKKVSMNSWVEKIDKPKKIVVKPWSAKEIELFEKIEASRLTEEQKRDRRRQFPFLDLLVGAKRETKQVKLSLKGLIKEHPHIEKTRRRRTKSSRY